MKQPFGYYGGKQRIVKKILPYIPRHTVYVEPFCGGASVFWNKENPEVTNNSMYTEVLNDKNSLIVNFFRVLQDKEKVDSLIDKLYFTPYSKEVYKEACYICRNQEKYDNLTLAWAFYYNINCSFANKLHAGWGFSGLKASKPPILISKNKNLINVIEKLKRVYIENDDAINIIKKWDSQQSFFYIDSPYPETAQGHYSGYTHEDHKELLSLLKTIKGSFILSGYIQGYEPEEWKRVDIETVMSACGGKNVKNTASKRIESLWIVDNGGGIEDDYFKKIYERSEFQKIWPLPTIDNKLFRRTVKN